MNFPFRRYYTFLFILCLLGCGHKSIQVLNGSTMGTTYTIKVVTDDDLSGLHEEIESELARINMIMSTYITESELSKLNSGSIGVPVEISQDLAGLLLLSKELNSVTKGAFDVTIGPLVNLWGFGPIEETENIPTPDEIVDQLDRVGLSKLGLDGSTAFRMADIYVDLSGIAKGFAVDRIASLLAENSYMDYLIEIGGELKVGGSNGEDRLWSIAVERPEILQRSIFRTLPLKNLAMATSGDYRNYREIDGQRYSHLIDPRTGFPITHKLVSVTVLHPSTAFADGLATGFSVLSFKEAMQIAVEHNYSVLFIIKSTSGFAEYRTPALEKYLEDLR